MSMNIYEALRESHEMQRALSQELVRTVGNSPERSEIFESLKIELNAHAGAEERFFYMPLMNLDAGLSISRHAVSEHHEIEEMLEQLTEMHKSSAHWLIKAKKLSHTVHHHLQEEEKAFFQLSGKLLTEKQKISLAKSYSQELVRLRKMYAEA